MRLCEQRGITATGLKRVDADVTNPQQVAEVIQAHRPDLVLNATAYNLVDKAEQEPEAALQTNTLAVRNLAMACQQISARFVHISTDYVFGGEADTPYEEQDPTHPLSAYAISKLAGEHAALAYAPDSLVVRTCGVFGVAGAQSSRGNFIETMLRLARRGDPVRVIADSVATPTSASELARCTLDLEERQLSGIFHCGGGQPISWFDYAKLIFAAAGEQPVLEPVPGSEHKTAAKRPKYSALSNNKMHNAGVQQVMSLQECVSLYLRHRSA